MSVLTPSEPPLSPHLSVLWGHSSPPVGYYLTPDATSTAVLSTAQAHAAAREKRWYYFAPIPSTYSLFQQYFPYSRPKQLRRGRCRCGQHGQVFFPGQLCFLAWRTSRRSERLSLGQHGNGAAGHAAVAGCINILFPELLSNAGTAMNQPSGLLMGYQSIFGSMHGVWQRRRPRIVGWYVFVPHIR